MANEDYKNGKLVEIVREFNHIKGTTRYEINGITQSIAVPFWREEEGKFKVIPKGSYKFISESGNNYLEITDETILQQAFQFQIVYVYSQISSKYVEDFPELSVLTTKYNELVDDATKLFSYLKSVGMIADTFQMTKVLSPLEPLTTWYMDGQGEIRTLPISDLYGKFQQMINSLYDAIKKLLDKDYTNFSETVKQDLAKHLTSLKNKTDEYIGALKTETDNQKVELDNYTLSKIEEIKNACDRIIGLAFNKLTTANTIEQLKTMNFLKVGDIVEVLGYYSSGDGAGHKRIIKAEDDGSGVQLRSGKWANLIKPVTFYYSNFEELKQSSIFVGAKAVVYGLVFDIEKKVNDEVGFEDELHIKTIHNVYANFNLDESRFDYIIKKQNEYIGKYFILNAKKEPVNIVLQGNSITYGHDTTSSDRVNPPDDILPDGTKHGFTRSPYPINVKLQEYLRQVTGRANINVINRGYSGDWGQRSYTRWRTTANSNITLFLLGQNDQGAEYVPEKYRNYEEFIKWNLMLGIREVLRGSVVVFTNGYGAPASYGTNRQAFLEMTKSVADTIGALFLDTSIFLLGADNSFFSDGVHLNTKGNSKMASRMCAFFLGENLTKPVKVSENGYLGVNYDYYNVYISNNSYHTHQASNGISIGEKPGNEVIYLDKNEKAYFPFYLENNSAEVSILSGKGMSERNITLDFGTEQFIQSSDQLTGDVRKQVPTSKTAVEGAFIKLQVHGKGFHVIEITATGEGRAFVNGIRFKPIELNRFDIQLGSGEDLTQETLLKQINSETFRLKLRYNDYRLHGVIISGKNSNVRYYYETYCYIGESVYYIKEDINNSSNVGVAFNIKVYSTTFEEGETLYSYRLYTNGLKVNYTSTAFNNPTPASQLNTLYHMEKMKQEGVYDDYISYMDEKTIYDKQQQKLEQDRQLAYEEALKENPELTYEEFMSVQPMTLNLIEEPQPSQALQKFMEKYL